MGCGEVEGAGLGGGWGEGKRVWRWRQYGSSNEKRHTIMASTTKTVRKLQKHQKFKKYNNGGGSGGIGRKTSA